MNEKNLERGKEKMKNELSLVNENLRKVYCSINANDEEGKKVMYNALTGSDILLNDIVGQEISVKDVFIQEKEVVDEQTGEVKTKYRTILIDENGQSYATGAYGVYNSLMTIFSLYGTPENWSNPLKFQVVKIKSGKSNFESLKLILK